MFKIQSNLLQFHTKNLCELCDKELPPPNQELTDRISQAAQETLQLKLAIPILYQELKDSTARLDPTLFKILAQKECDAEEWHSLSQLFEKIFNELPPEVPLLTNMLEQAGKHKDLTSLKRLWNQAKRAKFHNNNSELVKEYLLAMVRCGKVVEALEDLNHNVGSRKLTDGAAAQIIRILPVRSIEVASKILINKLEFRQIGAAFNEFRQFQKSIVDLRQTKDFPKSFKRAAHKLISSALLREEYLIARQIYTKLLEQDLFDKYMWNIAIDLEYRLLKDETRAYDLFLRSLPEIEESIRKYNFKKLDLHSFSHGRAALIAIHFIQQTQEKAPHIKQISLITGIGAVEEGNYLKMRTYIWECLENKFGESIKIEPDPDNKGLLFVDFL